MFNLPTNLVRALRKDLKAAGIPYRDELNRVLDVHALRHTTATHMAKAGVAPRTAQAIMRHSNIDLTMKVYTDPRLLDERTAVNALPRMRLDGQPDAERQSATGTRRPCRNAQRCACGQTSSRRWLGVGLGVQLGGTAYIGGYTPVIGWQ